jgi:NAD(P)H-hydrate epimerase
MNQPLLTRAQAREIDGRAVRDYGMPSLLLMENAGRGLADTLQRLNFPPPVVICSGTGNNGGDGFVLARHLDLRGVPVRVLVWGDLSRASADAATNLEIVRRAHISLDAFGPADRPEQWLPKLAAAGSIVDALLGTGSRGEPRPPLDAVIDAINAVAKPVLAVDLPSGLDCDTGASAAHTVRALHTATFVAAKRGFAAPGAAAYTGRVHVLDIGAPRRLVEEIIGATASP